MFSLPRWLTGSDDAVGIPAITEAELAAGPDRPEQPGDRRHREATTADGRLRDVIAQKVLQGWLQNRHQTLMPLSVNLARLDGADQVRIARFGALAAAAGGSGASAALVREWLAAAGAHEAALAAFSGARADPPSLPMCLAELARPELASLAFVVGLVAARDGHPASRLFADYVAARLGLPIAAIRSAERRYRA